LNQQPSVRIWAKKAYAVLGASDRLIDLKKVRPWSLTIQSFAY